MNRCANEFKFCIVWFYLMYFYSTRISDFMVFFRRLITSRLVSASNRSSEDCFDGGVFLFQNLEIFFRIYKYLLCVCMRARVCVYACVCVCVCIYVRTSSCFSFSSLPLSVECVKLFLYIYYIIYIYIYIVIHRQICFVLSGLISVARQYLPVAGIETRLNQTSNQSF